MKPKRGEIRSLIKSFRYAFRGFYSCVRTERNMRIHISVAAAVTYLGAVFGLSRIEWSILLLLFGAIFTAEGLNTAIEALGDGQSEGYSKYVFIAKDVAAGAVLVLALVSAAVGALLFLKPENFAKFFEVVRNIPMVLGFVVLIALGICFVFIGIPSIKKGKKL